MVLVRLEILVVSVEIEPYTQNTPVVAQNVDTKKGSSWNHRTPLKT
jgi:hypothetical protein